MLHFLHENAEQIGIARFFVRDTRFCSIFFLDWVALSLQNNAIHVINLKYIDIDSWLEHASFEDVLTENGDLFISMLRLRGENNATNLSNKLK